MPVTNANKDTENLRFEITTELEADPERVWQLWADPGLLERWWGPPGYPATFEEHDLREGGRCSYFMTGPEGEKFPGLWHVLRVESPHSLEIRDGFTDGSGESDPDMPVTTFLVTIEAAGDSPGLTRMSIHSRFESLEDLEKLVEMGMVEGMTAAMNQIDALL
jgi:uncharacterized protein YndB with AHSA1/START domain